MFSLIKILKALNSSQASYQLSLALVFGMISGFLPFFSLFNLFIIFVVFTLNIPLGIFSIFTILFSLLAVTLDPTFASIGYDILSNPNLNALWTNLYNSPIALWFSFNHTITMGSFSIAIVLAVPVYFISKNLFLKYRKVLEKRFKNSKYLSWLNPYSKEKIEKTPKLLRWWGSGIFIVGVSIIVTFTLLLLDPIIKFSTQYIASKVTNSKIFISDINTNINDGTIDITTINSSKDNQQLASIKQITIKINTNNLLRKKIDIEYINIKDINLISKNTKLTSETYYEESKNSKSNLELPSFNIDLPNIDTLLNKEDLSSIKEANSIKEQISQINDKWKNISNNDLTGNQINSIKKDYKEIETLARNIKTLDEANAIIKKTKMLKNKIKQFKNKINEYKKSYKADKNILKTAYANAKTLPLKDYNNLANKYTLDQSGALNIVSTYISEDIAKYTKMFSEYYTLIKPYIPKVKEEKEIIRSKGQYIKFLQTNPYPTFVIQELNLNFIFESSNYFVKALNISDDMKLLNKYPSINITGKSDNFKSLDSTITHKDKTTINANIKGINTNKININKKLHLSNNDININSNIIIEEFEYINAKINSTFKTTKFNFANAKSKSEKILSNVLSNINTFYINSNISANISNTSNMKLSVKSDLDKAIKKGFKNEIKKQTNQYKAELKKKLSSKIRLALGNMSEKDFNKYSSLLNGKSDFLTQTTTNLTNKYSKNLYKDKAKDKLKEKLKNRFKSLF